MTGHNGDDSTDDVELIDQFHADFGTGGNPLGRFVEDRAIADEYVAEVHAETIIGSLGPDGGRGHSVVSVWQPLDEMGDDFRARYPFEDYPEVYPKTHRAWQKVLQVDFEDHDDAMAFYRALDPETVEEHRQNEAPASVA